MVNTAALAAVAASLLLAPAHAAMYSSSSPVLQVDAKSYDNVIAKSNHTSIVEFYAPWCGHCQNLKPAYEQAAKNLKGLAKVAAVNCDEDENRGLCGSMGVQGFPTLKIVRPSKKPGRPSVEDYKGARTAKAIVDAVVERIPNHVKRVTDQTLDDFLKESNDTAKAILFSDKGTTSALLRALAIDFLGSIQVAQIRDKEKQAVSTFGVTSFPTLILLPGGDKEGIVYSGEMKKDALAQFLSQIASPNPDPATKPAKASKKDSNKKAKSSFSKASASHKSADAASAKTSQFSETVESSGAPTESPDPNVVTEDTQKPVKLPDVAPPIPTIVDEEALKKDCLTSKSHTCVLALLPEGTETASDEGEASSPAAAEALRSLAEVKHKHDLRGTHLFPFYAVPARNPLAAVLRTQLGLTAQEVELVQVNAKRGWWKRFGGEGYSLKEVEDWIDALRMGEGRKERLGEGLVVEAVREEKGEGSKAEPAEPEELPKAAGGEQNDDDGAPVKVEVEEIVEEKAAPEPAATPEAVVEEHDEL